MDERELLKDLWEYSYDVYDEGAHDSLTGRAAAEITQLRAELEQERQLADRLAGRLDHMGDYFWDRTCDEALSDWRTRRSK